MANPSPQSDQLMVFPSPDIDRHRDGAEDDFAVSGVFDDMPSCGGSRGCPLIWGMG
jgi:hypothetical protein